VPGPVGIHEGRSRSSLESEARSCRRRSSVVRTRSTKAAPSRPAVSRRKSPARSKGGGVRAFLRQPAGHDRFHAGDVVDHVTDRPVRAEGLDLPVGVAQVGAEGLPSKSSTPRGRHGSRRGSSSPTRRHRDDGLIDCPAFCHRGLTFLSEETRSRQDRSGSSAHAGIDFPHASPYAATTSPKPSAEMRRAADFLRGFFPGQVRLIPFFRSVSRLGCTLLGSPGIFGVPPCY
jgi:hypothetical protein